MEQNEIETLEQIAELIANLPSNELYQPDLMTADQMAEWEKARYVQQMLAAGWRSKVLPNYRNYPIEEARDRGELTRAKANLLLLSIDEHQRRWELCQVAEPILRATYQELHNCALSPENRPQLPRLLFNQSFWQKFQGKYPFESAYELFAETLREEADYNFSCCLQPYCEMPSQKWQKALRYIRGFVKTNQHLPEMTLKDWQKVKTNLAWYGFEWNWWMVTLLISQLNASKNLDVKEKLMAYISSYRNILSKAISASRQLPSIAWKKGKLLYATAQGGVYR